MIKTGENGIFFSMQIVKLGAGSLREKSVPVEAVTDEIRKLAAEMLELMYKADGVGLAAPQVGKNIRMFVADDGSGPGVFINPQITGTAQELADFEEGCLSVPGVYEKVTRPACVRIQAQDENGRRRVVQAEGFLARILQHEYDHLDGVLFIDHIDPEKKARIERRFRKKSEKQAAKGNQAAQKNRNESRSEKGN